MDTLAHEIHTKTNWNLNEGNEYMRYSFQNDKGDELIIGKSNYIYDGYFAKILPKDFEERIKQVMEIKNSKVSRYQKLAKLFEYVYFDTEEQLLNWIKNQK